MNDKECREIVFVTGNKEKIEELGDNIKTKYANLSILDLDLPEIQGSSPLDIVKEKCLSAFRRVNKDAKCKQEMRSVLVEDTCLHFKALNGMPGPYIKCECLFN